MWESEMDSACIAASALAKMSERRNNRLIDESLSGNPWFCIKTPGLNSGLMIPQYTQAGLLNEMRILATPQTIDNTPPAETRRTMWLWDTTPAKSGLCSRKAGVYPGHRVAFRL